MIAKMTNNQTYYLPVRLGDNSKVNKKRPYGTFEEAYMIQMLTRIPEILDDFIFSIISLNDVFEMIQDFGIIHLPFRFYDEPLICEYWNGLCRMYGNIFTFDRMNHIPSKNFSLCTEHLVNIIKDVFPPGWNIIRDKPILSLDDIQFM